MSLIKRFGEWLGLKEKLHTVVGKPVSFKEGEIWWCSLGENIGSEINGKSKLFSRPVVVFKKSSSGTFLGIPTTSLSKKGTWYVDFTVNDIVETAILSQIRVFDYKRLSTKIGRLSSEDSKRLKLAFRRLYLE